MAAAASVGVANMALRSSNHMQRGCEVGRSSWRFVGGLLAGARRDESEEIASGRGWTRNVILHAPTRPPASCMPLLDWGHCQKWEGCGLGNAGMWVTSKSILYEVCTVSRLKLPFHLSCAALETDSMEHRVNFEIFPAKAVEQLDTFRLLYVGMVPKLRHCFVVTTGK